MNYKSMLLAGSLLITLGTQAQVDLINKVKDNGAEQAEEKFAFETIIDLEATPVKNQARSGTCWSYATTSFVESEMIRMGKEAVDLSEMFTVRQVYLDKAEKYVRLHGHLNFAQGGALPDVLYVIKKYGAVPQEVYEGLNYGTEANNHGELEAVLKAMLDQVIKNKNGELTPSWRKAFEATLDAYLGPYPEEFTYKGKQYTPRSFADEVVGIDPDEYVQITSFTHHPFYREAMIQVPDNWTWATAYNVPLEEMQAIVDRGLEAGYTVGWATDVSEKGFSYKNGLAIVPAKKYKDMSKEERTAMFDGPKKEMHVDQEARQAAYDNYRTQDDHGMQITGKVKDQEGTEYYIVKNSWGEKEYGPRPGYVYVSVPFFRYKTISVLIHEDALSKGVKKKLDI